MRRILVTIYFGLFVTALIVVMLWQSEIVSHSLTLNIIAVLAIAMVVLFIIIGSIKNHCSVPDTVDRLLMQQHVVKKGVNL